MKTSIKLPSLEEVTAHLVAIHEDCTANCTFGDTEEDESVDVRLQVSASGAWDVHSGDPCYDTDHNGYWGAACISEEDTAETLAETAADLIEQAASEIAMSEDDTIADSTETV